MAPFLIALAILIYLFLGASVLALMFRMEITRKDHYLAGRIDQQQWDRITEIGSVVGGVLDDPLQVFAQQLATRRIILDLDRIELPEWDGHDRLGAFSEI